MSIGDLRAMMLLGGLGLVLDLGCVGPKPAMDRQGETAGDTDTGPNPDTGPFDPDGDGYSDAEDCDNENPEVHPGASEACDGIDNDCNGEVDEDVTPTWFIDADGDGYGSENDDYTSTDCDQPAGYVAFGDDCDDLDPDVSPAATELCDGLDNDCDGEIDEADAADATTLYADTDGDGYGDSSATTSACTAPAGYVAYDSDCDDGDVDVHPGADEICNDVDDDCDGAVDEDSIDSATWYWDGDGDGYGAVDAATTTSCDAPTDYADNALDCDDADAEVYPGSGVAVTVLNVTACIDGSDWFHLQGEDAWWVHRYHALPGLHSDCAAATTALDGDLWAPVWSSASEGAESSHYTPLSSPLPELAITVSVTSLSGRAAMSVTQQPTADNGWDAAILLDDDDAGGAATNTFAVSYTCD